MKVPAPTERLQFREAREADAAFFFELMNQESYIRGIADRGITSQEKAAEHIREKHTASYERNGFGLWLVEKTGCRTPIGISGLVDREGFDIPDLGYGFLDAHTAKGYAREAALSVLEFAENTLKLSALCAIVSPDNTRSSHLLKMVGFTFSKQNSYPPTGEPIDVYLWNAR
ncbi:GNAT family N-acetyltransferase [Labrenzia sp. PHM005]|uniref:GNAT family N-acetyltransferase n=1 Tax=Labrenzia sp. PHM005 TaxID=2590016 RepID=UPI00114073DF|nr:GNAT family N-acetyltransferase [Labrenzia sp. PHM005]QDG75100.1 GNAT family N-acetyltransferase [Labrenzia sp. PHM005]